MKRIIFIVTVALVLSTTAPAGEYRAFTNQDGKSIYACIVQYDAKNEKVQLQLKNRKKAWVQLSDLSDEDQAYIQAYSEERAKEQAAPNIALSKKELKATAEQYIQAWESGDIERVKALFLQPEKVSPGKYNQYKEIIRDFHIGKIGAHYVKLDIDRNTDKAWRSLHESNMGGDERWLLLSADGKIKYDSILLKHPIETALKSMPVLYDRGEKYDWAGVRSTSNLLSERTYSSLRSMGIPLFGLDLSAGPDKIDASLFQMTVWLMDEGDKWDSTEPSVFFPRDWLDEFGKLQSVKKQGPHGN